MTGLGKMLQVCADGLPQGHELVQLCSQLLQVVLGKMLHPGPYIKFITKPRCRRAETNIPTFTCPSGFHEFIAGPAIRSQKSALMISGF